MLTPEESKAIIEFLDRCTVTGHAERQAMNIIISKLQGIINPAPELVPKTEPEPVKKKA